MTTLTGIDPNDPLVAHRREFKVAAGLGAGASSDLPILLYVLKVSAGSEAAATIGEPVEDDADAILRLGAKSLGLWMYRAAAKVAPNARIYLNVVDENGSATTATRTYTFATTATDSTTATIKWNGQQTTFGVSTSDNAITQAAAFAAAWNAADGGTWPATATVGANPNEHVVTLTTTQKGVDASQALDLIDVSYAKSVSTTVTPGTITNGTGDHDYTAALSAASTFGLGYYHAFGCTADTTVTTTDNGVGEAVAAIANENTPAIGHNAVALFGLRGTQAEGTAVATSANSVWSYFIRQEASPHYTGWLAAHLAGILWSQQIAYPAVNFDEYSNSDSTPLGISPAYLKADWATASELRADANNGIIGVGTRLNGTIYMARFVTSRTLTSSGGTDYRARPGKIPRCIHFFWDTVAALWQALRTARGEGTTPNVDNDTVLPVLPRPRTVYPGDLRGIINKTLVQFCSATPFGVLPGPIFAQSELQAMLDSVIVTKDGPGSIGAEVAIFPIEALIKSGTVIRDISTGY